MKFFLLGMVALSVAAGVAFRMRRVQAATELPMAAVRSGEFLVLVRCRGELAARSSVQNHRSPQYPGSADCLARSERFGCGTGQARHPVRPERRQAAD